MPMNSPLQSPMRQGSRRARADAMDFFKYHTKLDNGEWVSDNDIKAIKQLESGTDYLKMLNEQGVEATNAKIKEDFETTHTQLPSGVWVSNSTIADIERADLENGTNYMEILNTQGITALRDEMNKDNQEYQDFVASHTEIGNNEWVTNDDWKAIVDADTANGTNYADIAKSQGLDAMKAQLEADTHLLDTGERVSTEDWNSIVSQDTANNTTFASIYQTQGIEAGNQQINDSIEQASAIINKLDDYKHADGTYDFLAAYAAGKITKDELSTLGISTVIDSQNYTTDPGITTTWDDYIDDNVLLAGDDKYFRAWMKKSDFDTLTPEMQEKYLKWGTRLDYLGFPKSYYEADPVTYKWALDGIEAGYLIPLDEPHRTSLWETITPWNEEAGQTAWSWLVSTEKSLLNFMPGVNLNMLEPEYQQMSFTEKLQTQLAPVATIGIMIIPGLYTGLNWDNMSTVDKSINIALDVITLIPILKALKVTSAIGKASRGIVPLAERIALGETGNIRILSGGKYYEIPKSLSAIDPVTGKIVTIAQPVLEDAKKLTTFADAERETMVTSKISELIANTKAKELEDLMTVLGRKTATHTVVMPLPLQGEIVYALVDRETGVIVGIATEAKYLAAVKAATTVAKPTAKTVEQGVIQATALRNTITATMTNTIALTATMAGIKLSTSQMNKIQTATSEYVDTLSKHSVMVKTNQDTKVITDVKQDTEEKKDELIATIFKVFQDTDTEIDNPQLLEDITKTIDDITDTIEGGKGSEGGQGEEEKEKAGRIPLPSLDDDKKRVKIPDGSIAWKQGMFWKYIPPPWNQQKPITLRNMPKGARAGGRTPAQTVQMIGEPDANVPSSVSVDLGVVDLYITEKGKHIEFSGGGLKTTVGDRLSSSTKGMSVGASASKVRHKSKPKKRKKRDDDWIPVGFRL